MMLKEVMQIYSPTLGGTRFLMFFIDDKREERTSTHLLPSGSTSSHPLSNYQHSAHASLTHILCCGRALVGRDRVGARRADRSRVGELVGGPQPGSCSVIVLDDLQRPDRRLPPPRREQARLCHDGHVPRLRRATSSLTSPNEWARRRFSRTAASSRT